MYAPNGDLRSASAKGAIESFAVNVGLLAKSILHSLQVGVFYYSSKNFDFFRFLKMSDVGPHAICRHELKVLTILASNRGVCVWGGCTVCMCVKSSQIDETHVNSKTFSGNMMDWKTWFVGWARLWSNIGFK